MSIFPKTRDEWIALPLLPFKVWVVIAFPAWRLVHFYIIAWQHRTTEMDFTVLVGGMLSVIMLLFGALIQSIVCKRGAATWSVLYAVLGIIWIVSVYRF